LIKLLKSGRLSDLPWSCLLNRGGVFYRSEFICQHAFSKKLNKYTINLF